MIRNENSEKAKKKYGGTKSIKNSKYYYYKRTTGNRIIVEIWNKSHDHNGGQAAASNKNCARGEPKIENFCIALQQTNYAIYCIPVYPLSLFPGYITKNRLDTQHTPPNI